MAARDDERSLALARRGIVGAGVVGLALVAVSMWTLIGASDPEPDPFEPAIVAAVDSTNAQELADAQAPTNLAGIQEPLLATTDDLRQLQDPLEGWMPDIVNGASVVDLSITTVVTDGGQELFGIADSAGGLRPVPADAPATFTVREGELTVVQDTPSGWPDPEIVCDGGNAMTIGSTLLLSLRIGPGISCTFTNTRDADSLSVIQTSVTCDALFGVVQGPLPPFIVSYVLYPAKDPEAPQFDLGTFLVEEPGPFLARFWRLEQLPADGEFQLWVTTQDYASGIVGLADATDFIVQDGAVVTDPNCS